MAFRWVEFRLDLNVYVQIVAAQIHVYMYQVYRCLQWPAVGAALTEKQSEITSSGGVGENESLAELMQSQLHML